MEPLASFLIPLWSLPLCILATSSFLLLRPITWFAPTRMAPSNSDAVDWIYSLDFTHSLVLVDSQPLFHLEHLPPQEIFADCIGMDSYGHRAYDPNCTPKEGRFDWIPGKEGRTQEQTREESVAAVLDFLAARDGGWTSVSEQPRTRLLEVFIGSLMRSERLSRALRWALVWKGREDKRSNEGGYEEKEMKKDLQNTMGDVLRLSLDFFAFGLGSCPNTTWKGGDEGRNLELGKLHWVYPSFCVYLCPPWRDIDASLTEAVGEMASAPSAVISSGNPSFSTYGMIFSLFECSFLSFSHSTAGRTESIQTTSSMPFLPSLYASSPSTAGITVLSRVGNWVSRWLDPPSIPSQASATFLTTHMPITDNLSFLSDLPTEIWLTVLDNLTSVRDIKAFSDARVSRMADKAAWMVLEWTQFELEEIDPHAEELGASEKIRMRVLLRAEEDVPVSSTFTGGNPEVRDDNGRDTWSLQKRLAFARFRGLLKRDGGDEECLIEIGHEDFVDSSFTGEGDGDKGQEGVLPRGRLTLGKAMGGEWQIGAVVSSLSQSSID